MVRFRYLDDIPTSQIKKQPYQFWCKNGGKMFHYAYDWSGPFPGFARDKHPTFYDNQKEHATQKVARVKGPRKKERKGARNKIENG